MVTTTEFILRLGLAFALGAFIGLERQYRQKSAGLRTNTLVSIGSAAYILLSLTLTDDAGDPSRVAGQIVTGIGFLGAGVIMKTGFDVQGLNTAATIWCTAAVGTLSGAGLWLQAIILAAGLLLTHIGLRPIGSKVSRIIPFNKENNGIYYYSFKIECQDDVESHLRSTILSSLKPIEHIQLRSLKSVDGEDPAYTFITFEIMANGKHETEMEKLAAMLTLEYGVTEVGWEISGQEED